MTRAATVLVALALAGCGQEEAPGSAAEAPPAPSVAAPSRPPLTVSPAGGPPGTEVTLTLGGLMMREPLDVGFGDMSEHVILGHVEADVDGNLSATVKVPADAAPRVHFFFLQNSESGQVASTPTPFIVTGADGKVTLSGRMSDEGVECRAMRGAADELYTLTGTADWPQPGTQVTVRGTIAEMSTCQQGITIVVESIQAAG